MSALRIQLLGDFQLLQDDTPSTAIHQPRLQALLTYLVLHRHAPQPRQHLAFLFWPDASEAQALTNLRKQLLFLRRTLPAAERALYADAKVVQWRAEGPYLLDVVEFEQAIVRAALLAGEQAIPTLQEAAAWYRGDLLPGCYDEWIIPKRAELREKYIQVLERLVLLLEERRDYPAAIEVAQRLLRHDSLHESTYRRLMRLHALNGDRAAALQVYHTCVGVLQRELGVEPAAETHADYERLLQDKIPNPPRKQSPAPALARSPFVGRQAEWQRLQELWREVLRGHARFLLIAGEAGIGKTRLAEELLEWAGKQGITTAHARAFAAEGSLAYAPLIEWLRTPALRSAMMGLENAWLIELARLLPELLAERTGLS
ncbi:MAG TPA: BTAD domain-containing putative transcriptional regulator, partial [Caldilineaceae bacterium]|nr:BTAD domain-containing putative transcriptional regulator [Caldilineaceae bacterium]